MKAATITIFLSLFSLNVFAFGTFSDAKISHIRVDNDGRVMIFFDRDKIRDPASCVHTAYARALGVDASTEGGKAVLSMALAAKATGSPVTAHGFGICGVYGGSVVETWNHGFIK